MCGICGIVKRDADDAVSPALLEAMTDRISHRGPDAFGYFLDKQVGLGHRRLSIIDLSGGKQPMFNEDGNIVIVFNGEIYNFSALRCRLEARGHKFASKPIYMSNAQGIMIEEKTGMRLGASDARIASSTALIRPSCSLAKAIQGRGTNSTTSARTRCTACSGSQHPGLAHWESLTPSQPVQHFRSCSSRRSRASMRTDCTFASTTR